MKDQYYKTISPSLAKKRIAKLVEASQKAWKEYKEVKELDSDFLTEQYLERWLGYRKSLEVMGIVQVDYLKD
jgi:hypothetical protein